MPYCDSLATTVSENAKLTRRMDAMDMQMLKGKNPACGKEKTTNQWPLPPPLHPIPETRGSSNTDGAMSRPQEQDTATSEETLLKQSDEGATGGTGWTEVVRKPRQKENPGPRRPLPVPRSAVRAATSNLPVITDVVRGSLPAKHIYVYHVSPRVSADQVKDLITQGGVEVRGIRRVSKENWHHGSFKVVINQNDLDRVMKAEFWPEEICCREWLPFIPQRTNEQGAPAIDNNHG
jgi:hypothetical protein